MAKTPKPTDAPEGGKADDATPVDENSLNISVEGDAPAGGRTGGKRCP
ncbi:MAG: hypothetical protein AAF311_09725 [Pseudomonadota bacterium]